VVELVEVQPVTGAGGGGVGRGTACYWEQAVVQLVEVQSFTGGRRWWSWSM